MNGIIYFYSHQCFFTYDINDLNAWMYFTLVKNIATNAINADVQYLKAIELKETVIDLQMFSLSFLPFQPFI